MSESEIILVLSIFIFLSILFIYVVKRSIEKKDEKFEKRKW